MIELIAEFTKELIAERKTATIDQTNEIMMKTWDKVNALMAKEKDNG